MTTPKPLRITHKQKFTSYVSFCGLDLDRVKWSSDWDDVNCKICLKHKTFKENWLYDNYEDSLEYFELTRGR